MSKHKLNQYAIHVNKTASSHLRVGALLRKFTWTPKLWRKYSIVGMHAYMMVNLLRTVLWYLVQCATAEVQKERIQ